jgi:DNA-binding NtrC family response regulator
VLNAFPPFRQLFRNGVRRTKRGLSNGEANREKPRTPILLASAREDDVVSLQKILLDSNWTAVVVAAWADALEAQGRMNFPIVLCDRDLTGLRWHEGVRAMMRARLRPTVILLSNVADPYLWDELVQVGGFDVLPRPFRREETLAILNFAFTHWKTRWPNREAGCLGNPA